MTTPPFWKSILLEAAGYRACFFGREGGVSQGHLASLNLGASQEESPAALAQNERRVLDTLGVQGLYLPRQVHGCKVNFVTTGDVGVVRGPDGDAAITARPNMAVGVLTADCVPVLLGAPGGQVAAAVHAGWRGLLDGIIADAVERLVRRFNLSPGDLIAAIGPAIGPDQYEVDRELAERFLRNRFDPTLVPWTDKRKKPHLDLRLMVLKDLLAAELPSQAIEIVGPTTFDERCFSHRRDKGKTGRQLSAIACDPKRR